MERVVEFVRSFAEGLGAPGLALIAFLDSSILSLPEIPDILLVIMVVRNPDAWFYYAWMMTAGSVLGCLILYGLGRKGGEVLLRRRFKAKHVERASRLFQRYGVLAIVVASLLPPPMPFKAFLLLAGMSRLRPWRFVLAVALGRGLRFGGEALLAVRYGKGAVEFIRERLPELSLYLALGLTAAAVAYVVWRRRVGRRMGPAA